MLAVSLAGLAFAAYAVPLTLVTRGDLCDEVRPSTLSDYGSADIGQASAAIPRGAKVENRGQGEYSEIYTGPSGVLYYVNGGRISAKEMRISPNSPAALPFGLTAQDGVSDVLRKLQARRDAPDLHVDTSGANGPGTEITTDYCLRNRVGDVFRLDIVFDAQGRLQRIWTDDESFKI